MAKRHLTPDDDMSRLLAYRLQRVAVPPGEVCADAETLASYVDDGMSATERAEWEAHFATCTKCRRSLALMARLKETASPDEGTRDTTTGGNLWFWMPLAACVLVGAGLWFATRPAERATGTAVATVAKDNVEATGSSSIASSPQAQSPARQPSSPIGAAEAPAASAPSSHVELSKRAPAAASNEHQTPARSLAPASSDMSARLKEEKRGEAAASGRALDEKVDVNAAAQRERLVDEAKPKPASAEQYRDARRQQSAQAAATQAVASGPSAQQQQQATLGRRDADAETRQAQARAPAAPAASTREGAMNERAAPGGVAAGAVSSATAPSTSAAPTNAAPNTNAPNTNAVSGPSASANANAKANVALKSAMANAQDAISPAQRAAGLLAVIADPARPAWQWRIFKFGRIEVTRDGGGTWTNEILRPDTTFVTTASPAPGVCWVVGTKGLVWHLGRDPGDKTSEADGAASLWQERHAPTDEDLVGLTATSAREAVVVTRSGRRFATSDGGKSWTRQ